MNAVKLTLSNRRKVKIGDIFKVAITQDVNYFGLVIDQGTFFGIDGNFHLIGIFNISHQDAPAADEVTINASELILQAVVNNLGFSRGYWEVIRNQPIPAYLKKLPHLFYSPPFMNRPGRVVGRDGSEINYEGDPKKLPIAAIGNFNTVHQQLLTVNIGKYPDCY